MSSYIALQTCPLHLLSQFSVDDFESVGSTPWEGVRNYEARNLMKEMVLGDKVSWFPTLSPFVTSSRRFSSTIPTVRVQVRK